MNYFNRNDKNTEHGGVIISNEVIASIAANAAKDIDGVNGFAQRNSDFLSKALNNDNSPKSVRVWSIDNDVKIQLFLILESGYNIQTVSTAVQRSVKNAVQSMTGKVVSRVNVCVHGIHFCEPNEVKA